MLYEEEKIVYGLPLNNLPSIWNDPYCVAANDDVDDVDVDSGEGYFTLSQSSLKLHLTLFLIFNLHLSL